jgi:hypothetical protein
MGDLFRIIPQPRLDDSYVVDRMAMLSYYHQLLYGRSLEETLKLLGSEQVLHSPPQPAHPEPDGTHDFDTAVEVTLKSSFAPLPAAYTVQMRLVFLSGRFVGVSRIYNPGLIAP